MRWLLAIEQRFHQIAALPAAGALREHLAKDLRVVFRGKYAIYYLPRLTEIVIVRVLHGSRDVASVADDGGFVE